MKEVVYDHDKLFASTLCLQVHGLHFNSIHHLVRNVYVLSRILSCKHINHRFDILDTWPIDGFQ